MILLMKLDPFLTHLNNTVLFSSKKTLYLWNCDKDIKSEFKGHKSNILNIYIKNENEVVTIAEDNSINQELIFWRLNTGFFEFFFHQIAFMFGL